MGEAILQSREQLEQAIALLETQRAVLGDVTVDAAIAGLRQQLANARQPEREQALPPALEDERKLVTVMFADISGFTAMSEKMDPEAVRDLMNACFERLVPSIERYAGTVDKFIGDEIMALFGAPVAHENDPERALRAALDMMDALAAFNAEHSTDLGLHFGINTGTVIAGGIGSRERQEYSVMGDAVNLAKRLEDISERGDIFVGPDTYRSTTPQFEFEALIPVRVKGKVEPVPVYRLLNARPVSRHTSQLEARGIRSPLVGRQAEKAALVSGIARLLAGEGSIVGINGEAGLGKSRLLAEVRGEASLERLTWLEGRALSLSQSISYWPFQEIVRHDAGIAEEDSEATAWAKLESRTRTLFPDQVAEILPYLASLLALQVRDEFEARVKYLDGEGMKRQLFFTSRRFFERLAQDRPLVLILEDLHWADESSVALMEHLLPLVKRVPVLICFASRPHRQESVARLQEIAVQDYADCYIEIRLSPLSQAEGAQLVHNLLRIQSIPLQLQRAILHKAEGNPFFLEEVIRALIDMEAIAWDEEGKQWRITAQVEHVAIPDTIHGVIMARVDRLEKDVKQVLCTASVIGRSFLYRVLRAIAEADRKLDQHLDELQQIELIREKQHLPELEYIFKHALAQEATYASILMQRRRELHAQVGNCIERLFADRLEEFYGMLAYHYARAEDWEKAQEYLFKAGDRAGDLSADAEALAHYQQAMTAYERVFGDEWDPFQRAVLERKIGMAFLQRGDHEQALEHTWRALDHLGSPFPATRWGVRGEIVKQLMQQAGYLLAPRMFLRNTDRQPNAIVEERALIYEMLMWIDAYLDMERALLESLWLLNSAEQYNYPLGIIRGCTGIGLICNFAGLQQLAEHYLYRAIAMTEQLQHPISTAFAHFGMGFYRTYIGQWDETTEEYFQRSAGIYKEAGDLRQWATVATFYYTTQLVFKGDFVNTPELYHEVVAVTEDCGDRQMWAQAVNGLGRIETYTGALGDAITHLQQAIEAFRAVPDYGGLVDANGWLGLCYLRQGKLKQALAVLEDAIRILAEHNPVPHMATVPRNALAEAYLVAAEQSPASEKADWLNKAKHTCQAALKAGRISANGMPYAMRMRGRYEWLKGKPKTAQKWWQQSLDVAEKMGMRYDWGMTHLDIGQHVRDRTHLEQAETILAEIGARLDRKRAQELIAWIDHG